MKRDEAKEMFRKDKDAYGKPKAIMHKIDLIYDEFEKELEMAKIKKADIAKPKEITVDWKGTEFKRVVDPFDCLFCPYRGDCEAWACTSSMCMITSECFGNHITGSWCPFDNVNYSPATRR